MRAIKPIIAVGIMACLVTVFIAWRSLPVVIFGDSVMAYMTEKQIGFPIINQSVGLLKTQQIANIIRNFKQARSFYLTRGVILEGGINDLILNGDEKTIFSSYAEMFATIPNSTPIFLIGIVHISGAGSSRFGVTNEQIDRINSELFKYCAGRPKCKAVKLWDIAPSDFVIDGLHLTDAGMKEIGRALN